jgi:hypothetical protein
VTLGIILRVSGPINCVFWFRRRFGIGHRAPSSLSEFLGRATRRLEQEETALGRAQAFCTLRLFLGDEGVRAGLSYEAAAQALNVGLPTLKTLIHRLRRRHTQLLREQVAQTVLDSNDVDAEAHALCEAPVQAQGRVRP